MKYGYFNYNPVGMSVFFYTDEKGLPHEEKFQIVHPEKLTQIVAGFIQRADLDHVMCNETALGLSEPIQQYLKTQYNYKTCIFELNK